MADTSKSRRPRIKRHYHGPPLPPFILLSFLQSRGFRMKRHMAAQGERCIFYHGDHPTWPLVLQRPRMSEETVDGAIIDEMFEAAVKQGVFPSTAEHVRDLESLTLQMLQDWESYRSAIDSCPPRMPE